MAQEKSSTIPKPRKGIPCKVSQDPDEMGRHYAKATLAPEAAAYRQETHAAKAQVECNTSMGAAASAVRRAPGRRESFPLDSQIGGVCTGWLGVG